VAKFRRTNWSSIRALCITEVAVLSLLTSTLQLVLPYLGTCRPCTITGSPPSSVPHSFHLPHMPLFNAARTFLSAPDALGYPPLGGGLERVIPLDPLYETVLSPASEMSEGGELDVSGGVQPWTCVPHLRRPLDIGFFGCPESHYNDLAVLLFNDYGQVLIWPSLLCVYCLIRRLCIFMTEHAVIIVLVFPPCTSVFFVL
jgi:hypothetical protein